MNAVHMWEYVLDILFPPAPDTRIVRTLAPDVLAALVTPTHIDGVYALLPFRDERVRACIHEAKFHRNTRAHALLATTLEHTLEKLHISNTYIIPIPLSQKRERERGYNQVVEVLKRVTLSNNVHVKTDILKRVRHTTPQTTLGRKDRLANMRDAFSVADGIALRDMHILLIDDVVTTGATLRAAKATLLPHSPASVTCIAFAH